MSDNHRRHGRATESEDGAILSSRGYVILEKMRWRTPPALVEDAARDLGLVNHQGRVGFDLDACAEDRWHLAPSWYTAEDDCLLQDWRRGARIATADGPQHRPDIELRSAFINPPWAGAGVSKAARGAFPDRELASFPGTEAFVRCAWEHSRLGMTCAALVASSLDGWGKRMCRLADEVWFGPRVRFYNVQMQKGPTPPGPHMLIVFRPKVPDNGWPDGPRVRWDWKPKMG